MTKPRLRPKKPPAGDDGLPVRIVHLDPKFTADGPDEAERKVFGEFWIAVKADAMKARPKRRSTASATNEDPATNPEHALRRWSYLKMRRSILDATIALGKAAMAGDEDAAKTLLEEVVAACQWFSIVERKHPDMFAKLAKWQSQWPVLASDEPGWEKNAVPHIAALGLGAELGFLKTRFRKARGTDANLPARLWAKSAVRVIDEARCRSMMIGQVFRDLGSPEAVADFCVSARWKIAKRCEWRKDVFQLEPLSRNSLPQWKSVVRQMIREDLPDFHNRPEWANQRRTGAASGRDSVGEIQNAILDDICSALTRLASEKDC